MQESASMLELFGQIEDVQQALREHWDGNPTVGIVLGTGLGSLSEQIEAEAKIESEVTDIGVLPLPHIICLVGTLASFGGCCIGQAAVYYRRVLRVITVELLFFSIALCDVGKTSRKQSKNDYGGNQ